MGKQIQIVGANNAPYVAKELDLESGNQFTFAKPDGTDVVEVGALDFIKAIEEYDTFKDWVVNYKRDENTIIPLRIDKIEGNVDTEKIVYTFTNDDVDVSSITLVKLIVEMVNATNEISASYVDETKEIEAGTVLPTPSADDNGKVLGVEDGAYALVEQSGGGEEEIIVDLTSNPNATVEDMLVALGYDLDNPPTNQGQFVKKNVTIKYSYQGHYNDSKHFAKLEAYKQYGTHLNFSGSSDISLSTYSFGGNALSKMETYDDALATYVYTFFSSGFTYYIIKPSISNISNFPDTSSLDSSKTYILKLQRSATGGWDMIAVEDTASE